MNNLMRYIVWALILFGLVSLNIYSHKGESPSGYLHPDKGQFFEFGKNEIRNSIASSLQPFQKVITGKVKVRFHAPAVHFTFLQEPGSDGFERLKLRETELSKLKEIGIFEVIRLNPQLELKEKGQIRVITDAELRQLIGKKPRSIKAAKVMEGVERDMIVRFPRKIPSEKVCRALLELSSVESCEVFHAGTVRSPIYPNDPEFESNQWGLNNEANGGPEQVPNFDIDAPEAWEIQKGNPSIVVAVIDNGPDIRHPDLYEKIWINTNELPEDFVARVNELSSDGWPDVLTFIDLNAFGADAGTQSAMADLREEFSLNDTNANGYIDGEDLYIAFRDGVDDDPLETAGETDDIVGWDFFNGDPLPNPYNHHGTAVAGLVGARTDNALDIAGVGWNTHIMAIYGDYSWPSINYAIKHGVDVITTSLAPRSTSDELQAIMESLEDEGIVFSTSLGNIDKYIDGTVYAQSPYSIAVSNFWSAGIRARGDASSYSVNTDIAGPGQGTWSLNTPSGAEGFYGTSAANPVIAGILSLMIAERGDLTPEQLRQVLRLSAVDVSSIQGDQGENTPGFDYYSGWGLANAHNALTLIHTDPWAESKITSNNKALYHSSNREELFHLIRSTHKITAFAGIPGESSGNSIRLERAAGIPPIADSDWISIMHDDDVPYKQDEEIISINRADLASGTNTVRLTVTAGGRDFIDYGRIDNPQAYLDIRDNAIIYRDFELRGFAYHPDFDHYELHVTEGHDADENDDSLWRMVGDQVFEEKDPVFFGSGYFGDKILFSDISAASLPEGEVTLRLVVFDHTGARVSGYSVPVFVDNTNFPDQKGFPVNPQLVLQFSNGGACAYDLTGDGNLELIVTGLRRVYAFRYDGTELPGWPVEVSGSIVCSPAIGDVTGDGLPNIVIRSSYSDGGSDMLYIFTRNGEELDPWPLETNTRITHDNDYDRVDFAPVLADLDADGDLEILLCGKIGDPENPDNDAAVLIYQGDGNLWQSFSPPESYEISSAPVVGDVDADGQLDVAVLFNDNAGGGNFIIYKANGSPLFSDPRHIGSSRIKGMVMVDLDNDDDLEVVTLGQTGINFRAYHHDGSIVDGWRSDPLADNLLSTAFSIGDINDESETPEIIAVSWGYNQAVEKREYKITVINSNGSVDTEWDAGTIDINQQPNIFDVDNDGQLEVLVGQSNLPDEVTSSEVHAFNNDATMVTDDRFPFYLSGNVRRAPVISDLDRDGDLEYSIAPHDFNAQVESHDLHASDDAGAVAWGMELHDPQRTSNYHGGLRIIEPTATAPTNVGDYSEASARDSLLIRLRNELPHGMISQDDLTVRIGSKVAVITALERVEGEEWITVTPPTQDAGDFYTVEVKWNDGGIKRIARQKNAVEYSDSATAPVLVRIDVTPKSASLQQGDEQEFIAKGYDDMQNRVDISGNWTATGGDIIKIKIDSSVAIYTARETGNHLVIIEDFDTGISDTAFVDVLTTSTLEEESQKQGFVLSQNMPNPFNRMTTIKYSIPNPKVGGLNQHVRLIVYDVFGNQVAMLVNENQKPGDFEVEFDASQLPDGIYLYNLATRKYIATNKMLLIN